MKESNFNTKSLANLNPEATKKYKPEYVQELIEFFNIESYTTRDSTDATNVNFIPNKFPTFQRFAAKRGLTCNTLRNWASVTYPEGHELEGELKHPDWAEAYQFAKDMQEGIMIEGGMVGAYNSAFAAKFAAANFRSWRERQEVELSGGLKQDIKQLTKEMTAEEAAELYRNLCNPED